MDHAESNYPDPPILPESSDEAVRDQNNDHLSRTNSVRDLFEGEITSPVNRESNNP